MNNIVIYNTTQREKLSEFFYKILVEHKEYISHGEMQMGIAISPSNIAPDALKRWQQYLDHQSRRNDTMIALCTNESDDILGFIIVGTESDGAAPFGVIYDLSVDSSLRGKGIGSALMDKAFAFLKEQNVKQCYLESGIKNSTAHKFFERYGFNAVSYVFHSNL